MKQNNLKSKLLITALTVCLSLSACRPHSTGTATTAATTTEKETTAHTTRKRTTATTAATTEQPTTEAVTEAPDPLADCPPELREILEDAKSDAINFEPLYTSQVQPLEWINSLSVSGNKFSDYIREKSTDLNLNKLSDLDRDIMNMLLTMSYYGYLNPLAKDEIHVVASGYDKNGNGNMKNSNNDAGKTCTRIIYSSDDENIYFDMIFVSKKDGKEEISHLPLSVAVSDWHATNFVDMTKFKEQGGVTPENVIYEISSGMKLTYTQIDFNFSQELRGFLYVYGTYAHEIGFPKENAKAEEAKRKKEEQSAARNSTQKSTRSGSSSGSSYGGSSGSSTKKGNKKNIDPDDLDIEGYYEDYKDEFDDIDDAWDDLMDNPDLWDDYY